MYTTRWCKINGKELKIRNKGEENEYEKGKRLKKWRIKRRENCTMKQEERVAREQSRLSISLTSGCCAVGSRKSSGNLAPEVHVVHARGITNGMVFTNANKHFYQLQNDSPARGCLPPIPRALPYPYPPRPSSISPIYRATSLFLPSFYTSTNFWSPAFPV